MHALSARELEHAVDDVLLGVQDDVVRAVRARDGRLVLCRRRADDERGARALRELRGEEAEPARDGVDEDGVARPDPVGFLDKGERGEALERRRGGGEEGDARGEGEDLGPGDGDVLGVDA